MTKQGALSDYFIGAGVKVLSKTELELATSHGHELQGIASFRKFIGDVADKEPLPVTYVWLSDEDAPVSLPLTATWYDSRRADPNRSAEYRFYYPKEAEDIVYRARAGDTLFLAQPKNGSLLALFCPHGSSIEQQLLWLFGLKLEEEDLFQVDLQKEKNRSLDIAARHILDLINIEVVATEDQLLEKILKKFGAKFPPTKPFSEFARQNLPNVDCHSDPDGALLAWMDFEERLFMTLEKHIIGERIKAGFMAAEVPDVEGFIKFSLGVQNRRKSRAGWAFGNHIEALLKEHGFAFKREATTEKRSGPDFLFPGEDAYHDAAQSSSKLVMLGAKTSCKDRWRQVLTEADRIEVKHLLTLEPGISVRQTNEMKKQKLQLVLPASLHETYQPEQRSELLTVKAFLELVRARQAN